MPLPLRPRDFAILTYRVRSSEGGGERRYGGGASARGALGGACARLLRSAIVRIV